MIVYEEYSDIFDSGFHALVIPVNTVGVMGKGLAKSAKLRFPTLEKEYRQACMSGVFTSVGFSVHDVGDDKKVICIPTKRHWRHPSRLEWIDEALARLASHYQDYFIRSIGMPPIGCGEGGLLWENVYPLITRYMGSIDIPVGIFLPGPPQAKK